MGGVAARLLELGASLRAELLQLTLENFETSELIMDMSNGKLRKLLGFVTEIQKCTHGTSTPMFFLGGSEQTNANKMF